MQPPYPPLAAANNVFVPGEPGTVTEVELRFPTPHYVLWGQQVVSYQNHSGVKLDEYDDFLLEARFWHSSVPEAQTLQELRKGTLQGDSHLSLPEGTSLSLQINDTEYGLTFEVNADGRISGLTMGPCRAPSPIDALYLMEALVRGVQRMAARNNATPMHVAYTRVRNVSDTKRLERSAMPYPTSAISLGLDTRFPGVQPLLDSLADGRRLSDVFGRFLAFYKVAETYIEAVQPRLLKVLHTANVTVEKLTFEIPEDPFRHIAPSLVGMRWTRYLDEIKKNQLRNMTAHLDPAAPITPFDVATEDRVRTASIVLHYIAATVCERLVQMMERLAAVDPESAASLRFRHVGGR